MTDLSGAIPKRLGPYRVEERLGGGMGMVLKAHDERLGRTVAIKYFRAQTFDTDDLRRRFRREARAVAQLNHPAIVQVFDFVQEEEHDWLVMEYVSGTTLAKVLKDGPLEIASALPVMREIAYALAEAHSKNVVHRDVKTENVMITRGGHVKLLDFGLARRTLVENPQDAHLTSAGMILGTPHAMSPEQADGLDTDHRSDLFSLGSLYYEALTGASPFKVHNPIQTLLRVLTHQPPPVHEVNPAIPRELSQLISQLLEKDREKRPADAAVVARTLDRMVGHEISSYITLALSGEPRPGEDETLSVMPAPEPAGEGRRHRVTVLVGELSGPAAMDAKRLFELRPAFRRLTGEVLEHFGGFAGRLTDRGFLACFGYPEPGENDARRAVNAARQVVRRVEHLAAEGTEVEVRLGIHSGTVAANPHGGGDEALAFGVTGEVASELARRASPGQFYLSESTHRRVAAYFQCAPLPEAHVEVPGGTVEVYRVIGDRV